jgi:hypothetical protein
MNCWNVDDVAMWLEVLQLGELQESFKENGITGTDLLDITEKELQNELQVTKLGQRKVIQLSNRLHKINHLLSLSIENNKKYSSTSNEETI